MAIFKNEAQLYQTDIDGQRYEFGKWGADMSLETLMDLSTILGKPLGLMLTASEGDPNAQVTPKMLDGVVGALTSEMRGNRDAVMNTVRRLCTTQVLCDHKRVENFDLHYKGRLAHIFRVVRANIEVQYGDFLSELGITAEKFQMPASPQSPKKSRTVSRAGPTAA